MVKKCRIGGDLETARTTLRPGIPLVLVLKISKTKKSALWAMIIYGAQRRGCGAEPNRATTHSQCTMYSMCTHAAVPWPMHDADATRTIIIIMLS